MALVVGGGVSAVLGLIGFFVWWSDFLTIIKGGLPILLLAGGILAIYVGIDEAQDKLREERQRQEESLQKAREEIEAARAQAEQYKEALEKLKVEGRTKSTAEKNDLTDRGTSPNGTVRRN